MTSAAEAAREFDPWNYSLDDIKSADPAMSTCLELARVASRTDLPILILGESGTGKTLLARAIHNSSRRAQSPFVSFNAAALSDTLLDSQLFGHEKGAFTGATKMVKGKFELADRGTLFIDEIADMSSLGQAKILRAVEYGEFERLGSETLRRADVRLMSATHLPLRKFIDSDQFRKDLFYRISGITLSVPPLRDRPDDLRSLLAAEIELAGRQQGKTIIGLGKRAAELLFNYHWPGNLRELKRVVHSAVAMCTGDVIHPESILLQPAEAGPRVPPAGAGYGAIAPGSPSPQPGSRERASHPASREELERMAATGYSVAPRHHGREGEAAEELADLADDLSLRAVELRHILRVLRLMGGNKRRAARALGLSRTTLDRKLSAAVGGLDQDTPRAKLN